jgi:tRNA A37 threonylcarbamoyladenosine dehydratase
MKTVLRMAAAVGLLMLLGQIAVAQDEKVDPDKLPQKVKDALKSRFPGAMITTASKATENGEVIYDIEMTRNGRKHEMDCKEDGTLVDVENQIDAKDLPEAVTSAVKAKHPNCTIKEVMEVLVVKDKKETRDHFEVIIDTAEKKEVELAVALDGKILE